MSIACPRPRQKILDAVHKIILEFDGLTATTKGLLGALRLVLAPLPDDDTKQHNAGSKPWTHGDSTGAGVFSFASADRSTSSISSWLAVSIVRVSR